MLDPNPRLTLLPHGLTVVSERHDWARSVGLAAWLRSGARHEAPDDAGLTHFLEHMAFKRTRRHNAAELARALETLGGQVDAYTTHESTCYSLRVLPEAMDEAVALLADILLGSTVDPDDVATEQRVVIEEIHEVQDNPEELVQELAARQAFGDHPLGWPVLGTENSVTAFDAERVAAHRAAVYTQDRLLFAAAGAVDHDRLVAAVEAQLGALPVPGATIEEAPPPFCPGLTTAVEDVDQVHLTLVAPGLPVTHPLRYALWAFDAVLGATMSSRLFQEVRERRGLVYHIASGAQSLRDAGLVIIDAITNPGSVDEVLTVILDTFDRLTEDGVNEEELAWVKAYARATTSLSGESVSAHLGRLARSHFYDGRDVPIAEILAAVEALTTDDLRQVAQTVLAPEAEGRRRLVLAAVGAVDDTRAEGWWQRLQGRP